MESKLREEIKKSFKAEIGALNTQLIILRNSVRALKKTKLNEDVLVYLIQQSSKKFHSGTPISLKLIRFILKGIENIEEYVFQNKMKNGERMSG